ncbi:MAG TPA: hypothetical protein VJV79_15765, partial [Polyangiaceae bacterium]|nr:hypothetical protein [Polyangiaceae bacterium]
DALDATAISGAHVLARDANGVSISSVAVTDAGGAYALVVPAMRNADGTIADGDNGVTLRADGAGFQTFPSGARIALPVDLGSASGSTPSVENATTRIQLIPINAAGLGTISGLVKSEHPAGTLVLAGGATGLADRDGSYTIFNVPAGDVEVFGYAPGVNLQGESAKVSSGQITPHVDLERVSEATAVISGSVQIVNAPGGSTTSVILVLEDTFREDTARGEAPPGLRASLVSGAFSIPNVPDGRYVVLAAFENDSLVRDPDTSIGGTEIVHVQVSGQSIAVSEGFKVTEALAVNSPGAEGSEVVSGTPTFSWADDSSEDSYSLVVFDALGARVWEQEGIVGPKGSKPVTVSYAGPALKSGMVYQFRATSIKDGTPISQTEDLKGVFEYK